ncbi:MAG: polyhydroxyalkanoate biosynthesis repressor PhaR, partial [Selenomonadaceae bacterium]|nr:polyhydroxyalkanoate biosynthesis repressor PhaR [Selenomonadaceae bacterium]
ITAARDVKQMLGGTKEAAAEEQVTIDFAFASVVTIKPIKAGEKFSRDNLWVKRPGTGEILAVRYEELLGKTAATDIENDVQLRWDMVKRDDR